eukprot:CAMPEP_0197874544 /NCGR_PEP_ID=MMETSP1439-20131203/4035_1 /TAXON_ID=66791 /ORGANISM="Gonyaulax spinifera, Strain CCMP409" /LENGTH=107 /DNA_ID=CAMNT_0043493675 /DNA_START=50 /DNA_END=370 /DNA_ORIENTATION=+
MTKACASNLLVFLSWLAPTTAASFKPRTTQELRHAISVWKRERDDSSYGHIATWDTSAILNMSALFWDMKTFNEDISNWDTSNVADMSHMFYRADAFNQDIGKWDTS